MEIADIKLLLESDKSKENICAIINNYFFERIKLGKVLDNNEFDDLEILAQDIINSKMFRDKVKNKILIKMELLIVLSKDNERYDRLVKFSEGILKLNAEETLEYLDILLSNCKFCVTNSFLGSIIKHYLEINSDIDKISEILCNYSSLFSSEEFKKIKDFIVDNKLRITLKKIRLELANDNVSYEKVQEYFNELSCIKAEHFTRNNTLELKELLSRFNESDEILVKMDSNSFYSLKNQINSIYDDLVDNLELNNKIKNDIISGKIQFNEHNKLYVVNMNFDELPICNDDRIITIDSSVSLDLDGAFSIKKMDDIFILNVFVSDVPNFLMKNKKACREAYLRGNSFYIPNYNGHKIYNIDMLPPFISHKYLSLNLGHPKNVIEFNFVVGANGEIYSQSVDRKRIIVTDKLTPREARNIIASDENFGLLQDDLRNYRDLCKVVSKNTNDCYLSNLDCDNIDLLVGFASILVNYFIGHEADFAIYRKDGKYSKDSDSNYTHSVTPIRRFVSNINLAFFLNQNGVVNFSNDDLYYVEDHLDEIIEHLNYKDNISKFVDRNPNFVKRYMRK